VVESGGGGGRSHAGASDSSLCATMLERTGGVLWVTRRKWTDWGQAVSNQSEISLIERGLGRVIGLDRMYYSASMCSAVFFSGSSVTGLRPNKPGT